LTQFGEFLRRNNDNIFAEEGHKWVQIVLKHERINILIELIREQLVKTQPGCRILTVHPRIGTLRFIPQP
jgi:hypothetical protein